MIKTYDLKSAARHLLEEANEVLEAAERDDAVGVAVELADVLNLMATVATFAGLSRADADVLARLKESLYHKDRSPENKATEERIMRAVATRMVMPFAEEV